MSWQERRVGDLCKVGRGSSPRPKNDQRYFENGEIPWIKVADATASGKYLLKTKEHVNAFGASFSRLLPIGSLIICTSGTLGLPIFLGVEGCIHDGWLYTYDYDGLDPEFFYYFLQTQRSYFASVAYGAAIQNINTEILRNTSIRLPTLDQQIRIAEVLKFYDDLIENNRRRMTLLEEAARQLYREWFVRLRFPGHEHTPITSGVAEGWREVRFGEVLAELESGGRPRGGAKDDDGIPSIGAENVLGIGQYDFSKEKYVPEEYFEKMTRGVVKNRDVMLYKDGANVGRSSYFGEGFPHEKCAVNEHVFILRTQPFLGQSLLYFWMTREENRQAIANLNANTAQPGISQEKLKGLPFLLPTERLTRAFNDAVEAQVRQIFALASMNSKLSNARDLLLPRLMSGEIAI